MRIQISPIYDDIPQFDGDRRLPDRKVLRYKDWNHGIEAWAKVRVSESMPFISALASTIRQQMGIGKLVCGDSGPNYISTELSWNNEAPDGRVYWLLVDPVCNRIAIMGFVPTRDDHPDCERSDLIAIVHIRPNPLNVAPS